jgi:AcrR family transcriptional regulator
MPVRDDPEKRPAGGGVTYRAAWLECDMATKSPDLRASGLRKSTISKEPKGRSNRSVITRERILDAAELLFAAKGFHAVSVRDITGAASVDVALVNYHFGSKQQLFEAVFMRRAEILNVERLRKLEMVLDRAYPKAPSVESIIDAFTHPLLDRSNRGSAGWKAWFAIIAQVNNSKDLGSLIMTRFFDPVVQSFIRALQLAMPSCDKRDLYWSYHFLSGALTLTFAETGRIDNLSQGICRSADLDSVHERLVPFISAGFRAVCEKSKRKPARSQKK